MTLWFVTPAYRRYELSAVCFDQRVEVIKALAEAGVPARCVVVADDENLDLARERGFDTVERDNEWLGRRFNDGMEYACRNGASRVVPIGSDSWVDPAYFLPLPDRRWVRTSRMYAVVKSDRLAVLHVDDGKGAGPYVFGRALLTRSRFRPAKDEIKRGVDRSTIAGVVARIRWEQTYRHQLQYVGFRGEPHLTPYETLVEKFGYVEMTDPWTLLAKVYPVPLVERARKALEHQEAVAA